LAVSATLAQHQQKKTVPPPKPADDGPSLEVTMKFIQDKLNGIGPVSYVVNVRDDYIYDDGGGINTTLTGTQHIEEEVAKVIADPSTCLISYHRRGRLERDGAAEAPSALNEPKHREWDGDDSIALDVVRDLVVVSEKQSIEEHFKQHNRKPSRSCSVDPPIIELAVVPKYTRSTYFLFLDEELANRVAKALVHAVELCGGGSEPEPF
jgi:hypothetical protein